MPAGAVVVSRPNRLGNPFRVGYDGTHGQVVALYRQLLCEGPVPQTSVPLERQRAVRAIHLDAIPSLRGLALACWCREGTPCHADVLIGLANAEQEER